MTPCAPFVYSPLPFPLFSASFAFLTFPFFPLLMPFWIFPFFLLLVPFDFSSLSLFLQHFLKFMTREVNEKWIRHTWLLKEPLPVHTPKIFLVMPSECTKWCFSSKTFGECFMLTLGGLHLYFILNVNIQRGPGNNEAHTKGGIYGHKYFCCCKYKYNIIYNVQQI